MIKKTILFILLVLLMNLPLSASNILYCTDNKFSIELTYNQYYFSRIFRVRPIMQIGERLIFDINTGIDYHNIYNEDEIVGFYYNSEIGVLAEILIFRGIKRQTKLSFFTQYLFGYDKNINNSEELIYKSNSIDFGVSIFRKFKLLKDIMILPSFDLYYNYYYKESIPPPIESWSGNNTINYSFGCILAYKSLYINGSIDIIPWMNLAQPLGFDFRSFSIGLGILI